MPLAGHKPHLEQVARDGADHVGKVLQRRLQLDRLARAQRARELERGVEERRHIRAPVAVDRLVELRQRLLDREPHRVEHVRVHALRKEEPLLLHLCAVRRKHLVHCVFRGRGGGCNALECLHRRGLLHVLLLRKHAALHHALALQVDEGQVRDLRAQRAQSRDARFERCDARVAIAAALPRRFLVLVEARLFRVPRELGDADCHAAVNCAQAVGKQSPLARDCADDRVVLANDAEHLLNEHPVLLALRLDLHRDVWDRQPQPLEEVHLRPR